MRRLAVLLAVILGGALHVGAWAAAPTAAKAAPIRGDQCVECHKTEAKTSHAFHGECNSCHVNAADHAKNQEDREKAKGTKPTAVVATKPESKECLSCHEADKRRMHFAIAEHNKAGVQCRDCHGNHTPKVKALNAGMEKGGKTTALCATCHQDVLAKFSMTSHHPVKEGGATCTGCHDPHASKLATLGAATATCTSCHQAVRGPHAFEHPPVAEDCKNCHDPHGSPNKRLLTVAQPMQCLQCHAPPGNRHGQGGSASTTTRISGALLRDCASCHSAIHGSANDMHLRF
ncbi:cytochrome c3 family protein [Rhodoferax sp.]|uniref:cytochrome c3 family protein n=1 Tax=Rhodoferax sp. TaxID=50421 RepID=UPI0027675CEE|nr:cytochrome c3 family protein [Rhodoferax sp.]